MKQRLTRQESQQLTRERLLAAAEQAFIRYGFDASSVEQIAGQAGYSRGAFYSNFRSKDDLFIEVLKRKRQEMERILDEIIQREPDPARRLEAVLHWYVNQETKRAWIILEAEFTLRAFRNRTARVKMAEFNQQRVADYSALAVRHFAESGAVPAGRPEALALALFAAARGLDELGLLESTKEAKALYSECRELIFRQLIPPGKGNE